MKYLLLGDEFKTLFVESKNGLSLRYNKKQEKWIDGGHVLSDNRVGFDPYEPEGSPYRYGCGSMMEEIVEITKEEAEQFIQKAIDENELEKLLNQK